MLSIKHVYRKYSDAVRVPYFSFKQERLGWKHSELPLARPLMASLLNGAEPPCAMPEWRRTRGLYFKELARHPRVYQRLIKCVVPSDEKKVFPAAAV
jgi:hypothetical protein